MASRCAEFRLLRRLILAFDIQRLAVICELAQHVRGDVGERGAAYARNAAPIQPRITIGETPTSLFDKPVTLGAMTFTRITVRPEQMGGVPCIRGLRVPVATVVGMTAEGMADAEILAAFPDLEVEDIREALEYAAAAVRERELPLAPAG